MGPYCWIQSKPIYDVRPCSDPHTIQSIEPPGGENIFTCIQKSVQHFELMHAVHDVNTSNKSSSQLVMQQLMSNESLKIWTH